MKELNSTLRIFGLSEGEIKTYLQALELGPSTVLDLSKGTKLSRQATYDAIESLTKRGLMTSVVRAKKKTYAAEHPERLLDYARRRETELHEHLKELERSLPELELQIGGERPIVKVYEGKEGMSAIMEDLAATQPKYLDEIADLEAMYKILSEKELLPTRTKLKHAGTIGRGLYAGHPSPKVLMETSRFMLEPGQSGFHSNISVYEDKIAMVTFEGKLHSVIIESKPLAKAFVVLFSLAYETAKKRLKEV